LPNSKSISASWNEPATNIPDLRTSELVWAWRTP
jgi:hypothetical protein